MELNKTHHLIFGLADSRSCSALNCPSRTPAGLAALEAHQKGFGDVQCQCVSPGICSGCVERWESGHVELRKKARVMFPSVFGLVG